MSHLKSAVPWQPHLVSASTFTSCRPHAGTWPCSSGSFPSRIVRPFPLQESADSRSSEEAMDPGKVGGNREICPVVWQPAKNVTKFNGQSTEGKANRLHQCAEPMGVFMGGRVNLKGS